MRNQRPIRPPEAVRRREAPRVARALDVLERLGRRGRKGAFGEGEVATQVHDRVDDVDEGGALLDARHARRAGPELVRVDQPAVDRPWQLAVQVTLELHDDLLRRELRPRHVRRARRLAATALEARVEVEPPLPGELLEPRDPESLGRLDVGDGRDLAAWPELGEEDVQRRRDQVREVRIRHQRDEPERERGVGEPEREVQAAQRAGAEAGRQKPLAERPADRRPRRPRRPRRREPARLDEEAAHVDREEEGEGAGEARRGVEAVRPDDEATVDGHAEPNHEEEAEEVEHGLVEKVEGALEELHPEERERDVPVDRRQHGAHQEREEAPEHDRVHDARVGLRERARLAEGLGGNEPQPLAEAVEASLGSPAAPESDPLPEAPGEEGDRDQRARVQEHLDRDRNVPEGVAVRHAGHSGHISTVGGAQMARGGLLHGGETRGGVEAGPGNRYSGGSCAPRARGPGDVPSHHRRGT